MQTDKQRRVREVIQDQPNFPLRLDPRVPARHAPKEERSHRNDRIHGIFRRRPRFARLLLFQSWRALP